MSLSLSDLKVGHKKYVQAISDAENDKEFAELVAEALENKIKKLEEKEIMEMKQNGE